MKRIMFVFFMVFLFTSIAVAADPVQENEFQEVFGRLDQIGVIVKDINKVRLGMKQMFGLDPTSTSSATYKNTYYKGATETASADFLFYDFYGIQLEFISPTSGKSAWQDCIDEKREGLHHLRFNVLNHERAKQIMAQKGIPVYMAGDSMRGGGIKFAYYDTVSKLGFMVETLNLREIDGDTPASRAIPSFTLKTDQNTPEFNQIFNKLVQAGVITRDVDKCKAGMKQIFGVEPKSAIQLTYKNVVNHGKVNDATAKFAFYDFYGIELEFIQPISGESAWAEAVQDNPGRLHHLRWDVASFEPAKKALEAKGVPAVMLGESMRGGGVRFGYFDSRPQLAFFMEVLNPSGK